MRRITIAVLTTLITFALFLFLPQVSSTYVSRYWAVIVCGSNTFQPDPERLYNVLMESYNFDGILYLSVNTSNPNINLETTHTNLQYALKDWLNQSTADDLIFIFIETHGGGYRRNTPGYYRDESKPAFFPDTETSGWAEIDSDEGLEFTEAHIQEDVNGDDEISDTTWVGTDEYLSLYPASGTETVWDDEVRDWLSGLQYRRLIIFIGACRAPSNETEACFSGGFIDDLSAPRRIIVTSSNETYWSWYEPETGQHFFGREFINALDPTNPAWELATNLIDQDGATSILEAYLYAYTHDMARKYVRTEAGTVPDPFIEKYTPYGAKFIDESPWLDDGGNFKPSFINGEDVGVGIYGYDSGDGWLARYTWLAKERYSSCVEDVNDDYKVDLTDVFMAAQNFGRFFPGNWNSQCSLVDLNEDDNIDLADYLAIAIKFGWTA